VQSDNATEPYAEPTCETKSTLVPVLAIVSCAVTADVVNVVARSLLGPIEICAVGRGRVSLLADLDARHTAPLRSMGHPLMCARTWLPAHSSVSQCSPVKPWAQTHAYASAPSLHCCVPRLEQGPLRHSSISSAQLGPALPVDVQSHSYVVSRLLHTPCTHGERAQKSVSTQAVPGSAPSAVSYPIWHAHVGYLE
jgi:hypothetical protein